MCSARQLKSCSHDMSAHEHCPASDGAHACTQLCVSDRGFRPGNTSIVMSRAHACMASTHVLQTSMHASTHVDHADGCDIACCIRTLLGGGSLLLCCLGCSSSGVVGCLSCLSLSLLHRTCGNVRAAIHSLHNTSSGACSHPFSPLSKRNCSVQVAKCLRFRTDSTRKRGHG